MYLTTLLFGLLPIVLSEVLPEARHKRQNRGFLITNNLNTLNANQFRQGPIITTNANRCPANRAVVVNRSTGQPQFCVVTVPNCPSGSQCIQEAPNVLTGWCCLNGNNQLEENRGCPNQQSALIDVTTNQPQVCDTNLATSCPLGYGCYFSLDEQQYVCCGKNFGCPHNSAGFINPADGGPQSCILGSQQSSCNDGFQCMMSRSLSQPICCTITEQSFRAGKCPFGDPLPNRSCETLNGCPRGYECSSSNEGRYCCPAAITVCNMPLIPGNLSCSGVGEVPAQRYYFDPQVGSCRPFSYTGCGGNANSFEDLNHCELFCYTGMCSYGTPLRQGPQNQLCGEFANTCPASHMCVPPLFGPATSRLCCPTAETICNMDLNLGIPCRNGPQSSSIRFWFNRQSRSCQQFQYRGCSGNDNNFKRVEDCNNYCRRIAINRSVRPINPF